MRKITRAGVERRLSRYRVELADIISGERSLRRTGTASEVDFANWLARGGGRKSAGFPDVWRNHSGIPFAAPSRVGVLFHVYFADLVEEIVAQLVNIPVDFDLVVTNSSGEVLEIDTSKVPHLKNMAVLDHENHGRDILPSISAINAGFLDPYELVLKVHTKKSVWREGHDSLSGSGEDWRESFFADLLSSQENVEAIFAAFAEDPDLGVVTARESMVGPEHWGADLAITQELLRRVEMAVEPDLLRFPSGSIYWARGFVLQGLRALNLGPDDFAEEAGQIDGTTAHAVERAIGLLTAEADMKMLERSAIDVIDPQAWRRYSASAPVHERARVVPFYLPQFHPTEENDKWWGQGFTEWTNVTSGRPVYEGHHQPRLPSDLGFYDLRLDEVRQAQMDLAAAHGIEGFMYYYYWFAGKRLLNKPIESLLASDVQKPYCIMWANENFTRRWDGRVSDILIGQDYDRVPAVEFIEDVMEFLLDDRYMRIDGKAVLAIYRIGQLPDYREVIREWRRRAREAGVGELLLLNVDVVREFDGLKGTPEENGLDGALGFPPHNLKWEWVPHTGLDVDKRFEGNILSYSAMVDDAIAKLRTIPDSFFPGVMVTFDNTARRQWKPDVWYGANPYRFRRWVSAAASAVAVRPPTERVVFINAWNEWAEGAVLEPSDRFGRTYLLAVRDVVRG